MSKLLKKHTFQNAHADLCFYMMNPDVIKRLCPPWQVYENFTARPAHKVSFTLKETFLGIPLKRKMILHRQVHTEPHEMSIKMDIASTLYSTFSHDRLIKKNSQLGNTSAIEDRFSYTPPGGFLANILNTYEIAPKLNAIVNFQYARIAHDLPLLKRLSPPQSILITGATGFIGSHLKTFLSALGHFVTPLERERRQQNSLIWNPDKETIDPQALEGVDTVIHLAGESLAAKKWSQKQKDYILENRSKASYTIARAAAAAEKKPKTLIFASAIGAYGKDTPYPCTENTPTADLHNDFPAQICQAIEDAAQVAKDAGIRVVIIRIGIVLNPTGGALSQMLPAFKCGLGGPLASGKQHMSWIGLEDLMRMIHCVVTTPDIEGIVNATAPTPVTNAEFSQTLAKTLHRPCFFRMPQFMIELIFGEMGKDLLLSNNRVLPKKMEKHGFKFLTPRLEDALQLELHGIYPQEKSDEI